MPLNSPIGRSRSRFTSTPPWRDAMRVAGAYALFALLALALRLALRDGSAWVHPEPWLRLGAVTAPTLSAALGVSLALVVVVGTRYAVTHYAWGRRLHADLQPVVRGLPPGAILFVAGLSSLGEELFFRSLLVPAIGVPIAAVLFGLAHRINGPSRWVWTAWSTLVGLGLGALFALTGSLVGPLVAHAVVNAVNLAYLRQHEPTPT